MVRMVWVAAIGAAAVGLAGCGSQAAPPVTTKIGGVASAAAVDVSSLTAPIMPAATVLGDTWKDAPGPDISSGLSLPECGFPLPSGPSSVAGYTNGDVLVAAFAAATTPSTANEWIVGAQRTSADCSGGPAGWAQGLPAVADPAPMYGMQIGADKMWWAVQVPVEDGHNVVVTVTVTVPEASMSADTQAWAAAAAWVIAQAVVGGPTAPLPPLPPGDPAYVAEKVTVEGMAPAIPPAPSKEGSVKLDNNISVLVPLPPPPEASTSEAEQVDPEIVGSYQIEVDTATPFGVQNEAGPGGP